MFDQIVEGTKWGLVNTTEDYAKGLSSYYEILVMAMGKSISFCLARNKHTKSSPFVSAIELEYMDKSVYNSTNFNKFALATVARNYFGNQGDSIRYEKLALLKFLGKN